MDRIYESLSELDLNDIGFYDCYFQKENLFMHAYQDSVKITDLTNALQQGKVCKSYSIKFVEWEPYKSIICELFNTLIDFEFAWEQFVEKLKTTEPTQLDQWTKIIPLIWLEDKFKIYYHEEKATRTYSPFAEIKPIKTPTKWTLPHVWKAILSGQITSGRCTGYYTDDYAYDAEVDFKRGGIDPLCIAKDLIGSPSGWWVSVDKETESEIVLTVCCHHFNNNKLVYNKLFPSKSVELPTNVVNLQSYRLAKEA
jgi:hypothetical protein